MELDKKTPTPKASDRLPSLAGSVHFLWSFAQLLWSKLVMRRNPIVPLEVSRARENICHFCTFFDHDARVCGKCGCFVDLLTVLKHEKCPIGSW